MKSIQGRDYFQVFIGLLVIGLFVGFGILVLDVVFGLGVIG